VAHELDVGNKRLNLVTYTDQKTNQQVKSVVPTYDANDVEITDPDWPLNGYTPATPSKDIAPAVSEFIPYVDVPFAPLLIRGPQPLDGGD
jgi:hypothetical protein